MHVTSERLENCQVRVVVELDPAEVENKLRHTAQQIARKYTIPGYRKGKAPYATVLRTFGREAVQQQALEDFGQELYDQAVEQAGVEPYDAGELEKVEWDPFRMEILLPLRPEVDLGDYRSVRVEPPSAEVTGEDVDRYIEDLRQQHAQWVPVERPAAYGDRVVVDIEGKVDGEVVLGNQGREIILTEGARYPLPGFHEQLAGMSAGEAKTFALTYPDTEPREDIRGREGTFAVNLVAVNEQDVPPLDDELALMVGDYDSLADLQAGVREDLEKQARERVASDFPDQALTAMMDRARIEFPPQAVDKELDAMLEQMESNLAERGLRLDAYLGMIGTTRQAYRDELRPVATNQLRRTLALGEIIRREGLTVAGEAVQAELDRLAATEEFQAEEAQRALASPGARITVMNNLAVAQARERVAAIARGEAPPLPEPPAPPPEGEPAVSDAGVASPEAMAYEQAGAPEGESPASAPTDEPAA